MPHGGSDAVDEGVAGNAGADRRRQERRVRPDLPRQPPNDHDTDVLSHARELIEPKPPPRETTLTISTNTGALPRASGYTTPAGARAYAVESSAKYAESKTVRPR